MRRLLPLTIILALLAPAAASAQMRAFPAGSLIIPMDLDYQNDGMLQAFGLVYQLLLADVTVYWSIRPDKAFGDADFTASASDVETQAAIDAHGYRAGPFVVDASQSEAALAVIEAWQGQHVTAVHQATAAFEAPISRTLTAAPTIAVFADGNEDIAFGYLNAAAIPDSLGHAWPAAKQKVCSYPDSPDVLCATAVRGPTETSHTDGALFGPDGLPVYCEIMTMHWGVNQRDEEVISEFRAFLDYPTHLMAECQAVNAIENAENGHFLTPHGYIMDSQPQAVEVHNADLPFVQFDGAFETVGGSEPSYSLPPGDSYYDQGVVMLTEAGTGIGTRDVWMTGYVGGLCLIDPKGGDPVCGPENLVGKVSYLGGHRYQTRTPIAPDHLDSQGTRLFLNSLFEADCATALGQPAVDVELTGPAWTPEARITVALTVRNAGAGLGYEPTLTAQLPDGAAFVSAAPAADAVEGGTVSWRLGTLGPAAVQTVTVTLDLPDFGTYETGGHLDFRVGLNGRHADADPLTTVYSLENPNQGDDVGSPGSDEEPDGGVDDTGLAGDGGSGGDASTGDSGGQGEGEDTSGSGGDGSQAGDMAGSGDGAGQADADGGSTPGGSPTSEGCGCGVEGQGPPVWVGWLALALGVTVRRRRGA